VYAVAGIGNNQRFFDGLKQLGIDTINLPFSDHYRYKRRDITFKEDYPVLMTEKDAVKCKRFVDIDAWYLRVDGLLFKQFFEQLNELIRKVNGQKAS
jgi:tetraacyldisaccharide 4'-kinase